MRLYNAAGKRGKPLSLMSQMHGLVAARVFFNLKT
jgi:hypothetical protein